MGNSKSISLFIAYIERRKTIKTLFAISTFIFLIVASLAFAGDCVVTDFSAYDETKGSDYVPPGGGWVNIRTDHCASFTIRNSAVGIRFDPKVTAISSDGKTSTRTIKTHNLAPGETYTGSFCLTNRAPITNIECSW